MYKIGSFRYTITVDVHFQTVDITRDSDNAHLAFMQGEEAMFFADVIESCTGNEDVDMLCGEYDYGHPTPEGYYEQEG